MNIDDINLSVFLEHIANTHEKNTIEKKSLKEIEILPISQNECIYIVDLNEHKQCKIDAFIIF